MSFRFEVVSKNNFQDYQFLFDTVYGKNIESQKVDLIKKLEINQSESSSFGILAYDNQTKLAGGAGLYTASLSSTKGYIKYASQIGDAMILPQFRKLGLFSSIVDKQLESAKEQNHEFVFTFPSIENKGSYKTFVSRGFREIGDLTTFTKSVKASISSRVRRKMNLLTNYETSLLTELEISRHPFSQHYTLSRSQTSLSRKCYTYNEFISLPNGKAWVSIKPFRLLVGDFEVKEGHDVRSLIDDLIRLASKFGKDELVFSTNVEEEISQLNSNKWDSIHQNFKIMIHPLGNSLEIYDPLNFNFSDVDVF